MISIYKMPAQMRVYLRKKKPQGWYRRLKPGITY